MLRESEILPMAPHQGKEAAVLGSDGVQFLPTDQEVVIDGADHMEAIGQDLGLWEMLPHQGTITGS
jgi:hypothetical protein